MSSYAEVDCVLKINVQCKACKGKLHEILSSISGAYSVSIDAEEGLAKIKGEMDPNILMSALSRNGKHAEIKSIKLKSPDPKKAYDKKMHCCDSNSLFGPYGCGEAPYSFRERRFVPRGMWDQTNHNYDPYYSSRYGPYNPAYAYEYPFRYGTLH